MRVEKPLHPLGRSSLGEVLVRQLIHRRDKGFNASNRFEGIAVSLALVEAGVGIERRHQQERKYGRDQGQQRRSEEHTSELQSPCNLVCRLLLEKKKKKRIHRRLRLHT